MKRLSSIALKVAVVAARLPWEGIRDGMTRDEVKRVTVAVG